MGAVVLSVSLAAQAQPGLAPAASVAQSDQGADRLQLRVQALPLLGAMTDKKGDDKSTDKDGDKSAAKDKDGTKDKAAADTTAAATEDADAAEGDFVEEHGKTYNFVGARFRMAIVPQFMFGLFSADGGKLVVSPSFGAEYAVRRNGFEYVLWLGFASYSMGEAPFKSKSDDESAWEIVSASMYTLTVGSDFLWSAPISPRVSFVYGGGAGIGAAFGTIHRNQAQPPGGGAPGDPYTYVKCPGAAGVHGAPYCGDDNNHYGDYTEASWLSGGSKPIVFPWIAIPQIGIRWKVSRQFVMRFDTGLSFPGPFFFGIAGQYGLL